MKIVHAVALAALLAAGAAQAQDSSLPAISGSHSLKAGFTPDPHRVAVTGGGGIDALTDTDLPAECVGNISDAPDFELTYEAGSFPLVFRTVSAEDTTLIVNGPDGEWSCDDDGMGEGGDAEVRFDRPESGVYDVWIGSFEGGMISTTLLITETP